MIKEGCEILFQLLILLIFYLNSQKSNLSLDNKNLKWGEITLWNKISQPSLIIFTKGAEIFGHDCSSYIIFSYIIFKLKLDIVLLIPWTGTEIKC